MQVFIAQRKWEQSRGRWGPKSGAERDAGSARERLLSLPVTRTRNPGT